MAIYAKPHSKEWFVALEKFDVYQAAHTRKIIHSAGRDDVCSICGDAPASDYKLMNPVPAADAVATIRLCDDCHEIRRASGEKFEPFWSSEDTHPGT